MKCKADQPSILAAFGNLSKRQSPSPSDPSRGSSVVGTSEPLEVTESEKTPPSVEVPPRRVVVHKGSASRDIGDYLIRQLSVPYDAEKFDFIEHRKPSERVSLPSKTHTDC